MKRWARASSILVLAAVTTFLAAKKIDLTTADLGRHLANGRWVLQGPAVLFSNFYSYTHPDWPFINHHWLSGLVFYGVHSLAGFEGLSLVFIATLVVAFALMTALAIRAGGAAGVVVALLAIPLVTFRAEIRPEAFSILMAALFYWILGAHRDGRISYWWLATLPLLTVVWVNLHIYFFFGILLTGAFFVEALTRKKHVRLTAWTLVAVTAAALASPFGWRLAVYPLHIFDNYGYMISENQSVPFFIKRDMQFPAFVPLYVMAGLFWIGLVLRARKGWRDMPVAEIAIGLGVSILACGAIRNIPLFGYLAMPAVAYLWRAGEGKRPKLRLGVLGLGTAAALGLFGLQMGPSLAANFGIGLHDGADDSIGFFRSQHLKGPIFNNYDIGSYLVYQLYPDEKVFVDNRPEAYPSSFFTDVYVPMQESDEKWKEQDAQWHFNAIIFNWHDFTPAGQTFLLARIKDPDWAPVFVDERVLIFLKRTAENQSCIQHFEIPKDRFSVRPG